ncbi:uncharacterized protein LOC124448907 isoform X2 [Xenia sp. Carnegie-2017]|uniref:uncharacterized protein LOC124448907 isoform X2 n=1 Tax=Xenia sp. Carnegie-2017 TaxID=2897299 RepID=UPI001F041D14|nr:uncharacterized protein LOC124448907 isoform X2 [Xenia sp. Carnegie-2017]
MKISKYLHNIYKLKSVLTGESLIFVQEDGERSIIMATGATSLLNEKTVASYFGEVIEHNCRIFTTEISQVPLTGVLSLLKMAKNAGATTILDLDVSPSVAVNEAKLGTIDELIQCVKTADILKPAKHAAREMMSVLRPGSEMNDMFELTKSMRTECGSSLIAITCGKDSSILATEDHVVEVPTASVTNMVDATGAGDAFLGGLIAGLYHYGQPNDENTLRRLGQLGNLVGATCCQVLGALPTEESRNKLREQSEKLLGHKISSLPDENINTYEEQILQGFKESLDLDIKYSSKIVESLDKNTVERFVSFLEDCSGRVLVSGIGKSGIVAHRMASSLASTGTPSHFIHASEWIHGDLGNVNGEDVSVLLSHSGNTKECVEVAEYLKMGNIPVLAIVGKHDCLLRNSCDVLLCYDDGFDIEETLSVVPSRSVVIQEILINGIVSELIKRRKFGLEDFAKSHPGGSLGKKLNQC